MVVIFIVLATILYFWRLIRVIGFTEKVAVEIFIATERKIYNGEAWEWMYKASEVSQIKMILLFWRPLRSFYCSSLLREIGMEE